MKARVSRTGWVSANDLGMGAYEMIETDGTEWRVSSTLYKEGGVYHVRSWTDLPRPNEDGPPDRLTYWECFDLVNDARRYFDAWHVVALNTVALANAMERVKVGQ